MRPIVWRVKNKVGRQAKVRLTEEGRLEILHFGCRVWKFLRQVDISLTKPEQVRDILKGNEAVVTVRRERG